MGFRGAIKKGGGFLNNVDGTITGYEFTDKFKGETKAGESMFFVPSIKLDGADEDITQHIYIGSAERYAVSKDGQELTMEDGSPVTFGFSMPFGRFMDSLLEKGFDESSLPDLEGGDALELSAIVDERFRFKQEVDEAANAKLGKRVVGTGKNKREYDRTNTVIDAILGAPTKSNGKDADAKPAKSGKSKAKEFDLDEEAEAVLRDVLEKGDVNRKNLSLPVTKMLVKNENGKALKERILDEDWQDEQDWLDVDKKGNLSLAA